jgi:hypothetical protein
VPVFGGITPSLVPVLGGITVKQNQAIGVAAAAQQNAQSDFNSMKNNHSIPVCLQDSLNKECTTQLRTVTRVPTHEERRLSFEVSLEAVRFAPKGVWHTQQSSSARFIIISVF